MKDRSKEIRIVRHLALAAIALIMFVLKQWAKKLTLVTHRQESSKKERAIDVAAINLTFDSNVDLRVLARTLKDMRVDVKEINGKAPTASTDAEREKRTDALNALDSAAADGNVICRSNVNCKCRNCSTLVYLTECSLCCESLQSNQIKACPVCANVVCVGCDTRLSSCAFCRSNLPAQRNQALERIIDRLTLPCKNARFGCKFLLDGETRFVHESVCNFSSIGCPVGRGVCSWHGQVAAVQSHLRATHNLQPLRDHGISVEIHSFRSKAQTADGRVYTVCLATHSQLFVIRVMLYKSKLRLCFTRLGHEEAQPLDFRPGRFGILVTIQAQEGRWLRGLVPFGKYDRESREVSVTCDSLYENFAEEKIKKANCEKDGEASFKEDLVKIDLLVKKMDECK